jgi:hypothetical protein
MEVKPEGDAAPIRSAASTPAVHSSSTIRRIGKGNRWHARRIKDTPGNGAIARERCNSRFELSNIMSQHGGGREGAGRPQERPGGRQCAPYASRPLCRCR